MSSWTYRRLSAAQVWPLLNRAVAKIFGAAAATSVSGNTMAASLPPSSRVMRLRLPAALCMIFLPVAVEPVKTILLISGWLDRAAPRLPSPVTILNTPGGTSSLMISAARRVVSGVYSEGLITTVLPLRRAGMVCQMAIIRGKFQGVMEPITPSGLRCTSMRASSLSWITSTGSSRSAVACAQAMVPPISKAAPMPANPTPGLPCSRVSNLLNSSECASRASAIACTMRERSASGVALQDGNARRAAATAWSTCSGVALGHWAITSSVAGFRTGKVSAVATFLPSIISL